MTVIMSKEVIKKRGKHLFLLDLLNSLDIGYRMDESGLSIPNPKERNIADGLEALIDRVLR